MIPLAIPFSIGGVGGSCPVTHSGRFLYLPNTKSMNSAYFSPTIPFNLLSLGQLQRCGASYSPEPLRPHTHISILSSPSGPLLAHATLTAHNLLPVDFAALHHASTLSPAAYYQPLAMSTTFHTLHANAEQRARADAAEELHNDLCHPSDRSLCANLSTGKLPLQYPHMHRCHPQPPPSRSLPPLHSG